MKQHIRSAVAYLGWIFSLGSIEAFGVPAQAEEAIELRVHGSPIAALNYILAQSLTGPQPSIIAFGEYHETNADAQKKGKGKVVPSALRRFKDQLLLGLSESSSDLVLETWITDGNCGKQETAAVQDVKKTTQRPETTEDDLVTLVKQCKAAGVTPHILKLSCDDYKSLLGGGEVDYEKLLKLITELMQKKVVEISRRREKDGSHKHVLIYGGALHNDVNPKPELAAFSFGPALQKTFGQGYVEIDLYVPEFVERDPSLVKEPWYAEYKKRSRSNSALPDRTVVIKRNPNSYILLFSRSKH